MGEPGGGLGNLTMYVWPYKVDKIYYIRNAAKQ
jgi:hypothetical protein